MSRPLCFVLLVVGLAWLGGDPQPAAAQSPDKGYVIRVVDGVVFIDLGRRDGIQTGDLYDIVTAAVLADPLSGDTLDVTLESVGALRVVQVFEKMAAAEVVQLQPGEDPMMMRIAPIQDPERLLEVEMALSRGPRRSGGGGLGLASLVPGLPQWRAGRGRRGFLLAAAQTATLGAGIGYRLSSNDWKDQYDRLPAGLPASEYERYFDEADDRRTWSNRFFWAAGAVYACHWLDLLWSGGDGGGTAARAAFRPSLTLGVDQRGVPLLQLVRSF